MVFSRLKDKDEILKKDGRILWQEEDIHSTDTGKKVQVYLEKTGWIMRVEWNKIFWEKKKVSYREFLQIIYSTKFIETFSYPGFSQGQNTWVTISRYMPWYHGTYIPVGEGRQ